MIATHWHRDHVRGLAEVVARCVQSEFWTSAALTSREALVLTGRMGSTTLTAQSPLRELYEVLQRLRVRSEGLGDRAIKTAQSGSVLYRRVRAGEEQASVVALSPQDEAVTYSRHRLRDVSEIAPGGVFAAPEIHPNHAAIALRVRFGACSAVLGSDLENGAPGGGWAGIVADGLHEPAAVYKVPHHGSVTSHEPAVWHEMLQEDAVAAVTPFRPERLPRGDMVETIVGVAGRAFITAPPTRPSQPQRPRRTKALQRGTALRVEEIEGRSGHVRARCPSGSAAGTDVVVDLSLPALRLESLLGA